MNALVTGAACFIGIHVSKVNLEDGDKVIGIGNLNDCYGVRQELDCQKLIKDYDNFNYIKMDISD